MTSYYYHLILTDSELIMLEEALKLMIEHCNNELSERIRAPYFAHKESAKKVLEKLIKCEPEFRSGNNFNR